MSELVEVVVAAYRGLNARLGWIEDPAALDGLIRAEAEWRLHDDGEGLLAVAIYVQDELAEELTEPWPLRALDHPPGQRTAPDPEVTVSGGVAHIAYGPFALDPIGLPA